MSNIRRDQLPYPNLPVQEGESTPQRSSESASNSASATVIDRQSRFNGTFRADSDLRIEGTFEGEIDCNGTVIVAEDATLSATVHARNIVIAGSASGEFTCDERFTIQATGEMRGRAQAATLVVQEGAFFEGEFRMGGNGATANFSNRFSSWESGRGEERSYTYLEDNGPARVGEDEGGAYSGENLWEEDEDGT